MLPSPAKAFASLVALALLGVGCTSSGLSGGGSSKGTKKENAGTGGKEESGSATDTSTGTDQEIGGNDAGDFAFPEDVAGAYLTCQHASSAQGSAQFSCAVFVGTSPDPRVVNGVAKGQLLGAEASQIATMKAEASDNGQVLVTLTSTGMAPALAPVEFGLSLDLTFADGSASTVETPCVLYVPESLYGDVGCPAGYVGDSTILSDGRSFEVCVAEQGGGGSIEATWTRFPGTDVADYAPSFVPENAAGQCDASQKVAVPFDTCSCSAAGEWIKGTISLPSGGNPFSSPDICFVVETEVQICGKPKTISGSSH